MIHLQSPITNASFCGHLFKGDILTSEQPPHNRVVSKLCQECKCLYDKNIEDECQKGQEAWNNRSPREKLHDGLVGLSMVGESDMGIILDLILIVGTCGTILWGKKAAKALLKAGV